MQNPSTAEVLMCRPTYFEVIYEINPWMHNQHVDTAKALEQWNNLVEAYRNNGIIVNIIEQVQGLPDMAFAADQAVVTGKTALMANFAKEERRSETTHYETWFKEHGFTLHHLPADEYFEGNGELQPWNGQFFIGTGFRTSEKSLPTIEEILGKPLQPITLIDPYFYHLDTCLFPLDDETVFYFPDAIHEDSQEILKNRVTNLISLSREEANTFVSNSVVIGKTVFCQKVLPEFKRVVEERGFTLIEVDVSEFNKSGGGIHCLTNPIAVS